MISQEDISSIALEKFLTLNPKLQVIIKNLEPNEADALGLSMEDFRQLTLSEAFNEHVEVHGLDSFEYMLELSVSNEQEKHKMRLQHHQEIANALGMEFIEYCNLNNIDA